MKKHILAAGAAAVALGIASVASAANVPCAATVAHPGSAKQIKAALVQAFVSCNNPGGNVSNSESETGEATCFPAEPIGSFNNGGTYAPLSWFWGPKSKADITFKAGKNKITGGINLDPNAIDLYITLKMADIRDNTGLVDGQPGNVNILSRATIIDRAESKPMTIFDFPTSFEITPAGGKVSHKTSATAIINDLDTPALPPCTTIELVDLEVRDRNGNPFAVIGTYMP